MTATTTVDDGEDKLLMIKMTVTAPSISLHVKDTLTM